MNRAIYFASAVVALISVLLVQSMGGLSQATPSVSSFSLTPESTVAVAPDSGSSEIDALAAWPAAATR